MPSSARAHKDRTAAGRIAAGGALDDKAHSGRTAAGWDDVVVRPLAQGDIDAYVDYWHDLANGFLDDLGIDRSRLPSPARMREQLALSLECEDAQSSLLTIVCDGLPVGVHELTDMPPEGGGPSAGGKDAGHGGGTAVMHAHMWSPTARGRGIGRISYVKAMGVYFERYGLAAIEFRTPKTNLAANRVKHHLGLGILGDTLYALPIFRAPIPSHLYRVAAEDHAALAARARQAFL